jgi:hypothetical protein
MVGFVVMEILFFESGWREFGVVVKLVCRRLENRVKREIFCVLPVLFLLLHFAKT